MCGRHVRHLGMERCRWQSWGWLGSCMWRESARMHVCVCSIARIGFPESSCVFVCMANRRDLCRRAWRAARHNQGQFLATSREARQAPGAYCICEAVCACDVSRDERVE